MNVDKEIEKKLATFEAWRIGISAFIVLFSLSICGLMVYQLTQLHSNQAQLEQLTLNLCETLERAGIIIQGSEENPCGPG